MKKLMTSTIILLPILLLAILLVSGAIVSMGTHIYVETVEFVDDQALVLVMSDEDAPPTYDLSPDITILPLKAKNRDLSYAAADESLVRVDEKGVVTAVYYGETYITVASKENKAAVATRKVIVTDTTAHKIVMKDYNAEMYKGDTQRLLYEVFPAEANSMVRWTTSDPAVVSVSPNGEVTCTGRGTATVTAASADDPTVSASATFSCFVPLVGISAEVSKVTTAEETAQFPELTVMPVDADYTLTYGSSDENVATVESDGRITVHNAGSVVITATARDGRDHTASASVTFHCTNGYYMGPLFGEKSSFTFDYDDWAGQTLDEIELVKTPEHSYRQIVAVTVSDPDLISFDETAERFILNEVPDDRPLGNPVTVTIKAKKYNERTGALEEVEEDRCEIRLTRNVRALSFVSGGEAIGELGVTRSSINLSATGLGGAGGVGVAAQPANHTNTLSFEVTAGNAHIRGSALIFDAPGTAVVTVTAKDGSGAAQHTASLSVTYTEPQDEDLSFEVTGETQDARFALDLHTNGAMKRILLTGSAPEGMTRVVTVDREDVVEVQGNYLIPKKGGFASVTVSFEPVAGGAMRAAVNASAVCTIGIYVDHAVETGDISVDADDFTTSLERLGYTLTVGVSADAMEGKEFFVDGEKVNLIEQDGALVYHGTIEFASDRPSATIGAEVRYAERAKEYGAEKTGVVCEASATVRTTHGKLTASPTVTYGEGTRLEAGRNNTIEFSDLGEEIVLTVDAQDPAPSDFILTEEKISISRNAHFGYRIGTVSENVASVTLTAEEGGGEDFTLTVAGVEYPIHVRIAAPADRIEVRYGNEALSDGETYTTFLDLLGFYVTIGRADGKAITDKTVQWSAGGTYDRLTAAGDSAVIEGIEIPSGASEIVFASGKASFTLHVVRTSLAEQELVYYLEYQVSGDVETCEPFSVDASSSPVEFTFPKAMNGVFSLCIDGLDADRMLGGLTEELMEAYFSLRDEANGWEWPTAVNVANRKIDVTLPAEHPYFVNAELVFVCGENSVTLVLTRSNIESIEFTGFDSGDRTNGGDVYKGYQQVRVFAKHSDYGGTEVDYFKIPLVVLSDLATGTHAEDLSLLTWTLTGWKENAPTDFVITQRGMNVTYGGAEYTIVENGGHYVLQTASGDTVVDTDGRYASGRTRVPWVDIYSEEGFARIYFGEFGGLSESDVQNDYFGNFAEAEQWQAVPGHADDYDGSGRLFTPSANAYGFLRVEAGIGAKGGTSEHFNFNVLEGDDLCNVFDAAGYYAHAKVVLHEDLYGPGELDGEGAEAERKKAEANEKGLFLNETSTPSGVDSTKLGKALIYGNGYQINLEARHKTIPNTNYNNSATVDFGTLYNVTVKGCNPTEKVNVLTVRQYIRLKGIYYSDLQYYTKLYSNYSFKSTDGKDQNRIFIKNTTLRFCSQQAVMLWASYEAVRPYPSMPNYTVIEGKGYSDAYIENVVETECMMGICSMGYGPCNTFYLRGFLDALNYVNPTDLGAKADMMDMGALKLGQTIENSALAATSRLEWFGQKKDLFRTGSDGHPEATENAFINAVLVGLANGTDFNKFWWDGTQYTLPLHPQYGTEQKSGPIPIGDGSMIKSTEMHFGGMFEGWIYNDDSTLDGGPTPAKDTTGMRDMSKLFTDDRYIRLLCQYTSMEEDGTPVWNTQHIMWHVQKVYRDPSLIADRKSHIEDLKESLIGKGIEWPDGSTPEQAVSAEAAALARMVSETVIPGKED